MRIDNSADRPESAGLSLDPDPDAFLPTGFVDPMEHPLGKPTAVGGNLHGSTIQSPRTSPGEPLCEIHSHSSSPGIPPRIKSSRTSPESTGGAAAWRRSFRIATS